MKGVIDAAWLEFVRMVLTPEVGAVQVREMRRAFFAGAGSLFSTLTEGISPGVGNPTDGDMDLMSGIEAELQAYLADLREGRA